MASIDRVLAECLSLEREGKGQLTLAPTLQGFPETAHGGGVLAAFDLIAARAMNAAGAARMVTAQIQKTIPLQTSLPLTVEAGAATVALTLGDDGKPLASCRVTRGVTEATRPLNGWSGPPEKSLGFPTARGCLACGSENPIGLRVRLRFADHWVWAEYHPSETYRAADGRIAPALFTVLLDEMAWWLGALASGEAGVTTELTVALHRPNQLFGDTLLAVGARDRVTAAGERGHFWKTEAAVLASDGALLASGAITFAGSRAYSKRLVPRLLEWNPPERLRPIFPTHVP
jgi:acyl-coenzyme A thioesterase PaaI-like protein